MIYAAYDSDGVLVDVATDTGKVEAFDKAKTKTINLTTDGAATFKAMLWNSFSTGKPYIF